jgi:hypothetical protein
MLSRREKMKKRKVYRNINPIMQLKKRGVGVAEIKEELSWTRGTGRPHLLLKLNG